MSQSEHDRAIRRLSDIISTNDWDRLSEAMHDDAVLEYPQSGERFRGLENIRAQFVNYPDLDPGGSQLTEVIGQDTFALSSTYTRSGWRALVSMGRP